MENTGSYVNQFTKLQKMKGDLVKHNKQSEYSEDHLHFKTTKLTVKKKNYLDVKDRRRKLTTNLAALHTRFLSMKQLYIKSRSNTFEESLKKLFEDIHRAKNELEKLPSDTASVFVDISSPNEDEIKDESSSKKKNNIKTASVSASKKKAVRKFLFNTYEQCVSQKTKEPTYMSKADIIKHIKEHDPTLLRHMPKSITSMKKDAICKVIFP